jgi:hypothetical protein
VLVVCAKWYWISCGRAWGFHFEVLKSQFLVLASVYQHHVNIGYCSQGRLLACLGVGVEEDGWISQR